MLSTLPGSRAAAGLPDGGSGVVNALTIDVEDYFQVSAFDGHVSRDDWPSFESRVSRNTDRLLELFDEAGTRATFFVLGWVAERYPELIRRIHAGGHELASHGFGHQLVYTQTPERFREDLRRARATIEACTGAPVLGYRAPSFSITRESLWAFDVLIEEGYAYDSSVYPIHHDRYGIPGWPRHPHVVERAGGRIWEIPGSTVRWGRFNLPVGGGGYFRLLPYRWTRLGIDRLNRVESTGAIFYLHPWEIDPAQPRLPVGLLTGIRHYRNLGKTEARLRRLLREFRFSTMQTMLGLAAGAPLTDVPLSSVPGKEISL